MYFPLLTDWTPVYRYTVVAIVRSLSAQAVTAWNTRNKERTFATTSVSFSCLSQKLFFPLRRVAWCHCAFRVIFSKTCRALRHICWPTRTDIDTRTCSTNSNHQSTKFILVLRKIIIISSIVRTSAEFLFARSLDAAGDALCCCFTWCRAIDTNSVAPSIQRHIRVP